ncbi:hypothetical protein HN51_033249 [Arachis hypogaea]|uniref:probable NAD(P)H dehydrogenase subunit CRR3, chloroplastic n=1 Tax=Arachis hypogaea TaxID=3818 RepID=UPI000DECEB78|nr:probable NAD(P)H dehydrogenase subunit CRR3, chloroplastic [Arachis hypogaea]
MMKMLCLSNIIPINKTILASSPNNDVPIPPPPPSSPKRRKVGPRRPPKPTVIQIERIVGAGSFRDGEQAGDSDVRKSVFDLFLGQAFEGPVEKKIRTTGEWLLTNAEPRFQKSGKGILKFIFQLMLPIWIMSLLVASGVIKLPFSSPFLDDLLL